MDFNLDFEKYEIHFNGEEVGVELRPLTTDVLMKLTPHMVGNEADMKEYIEKQLGVTVLAKEILPEFAQHLTNITVKGNVPTWETLCNSGIFAQLVIKIVLKLISISSISEEDEGNSSGPSTDSEAPVDGPTQSESLPDGE